MQGRGTGWSLLLGAKQAPGRPELRIWAPRWEGAVERVRERGGLPPWQNPQH